LIHVSSAILAILLVGLFAWYSRRMRVWDERLQHSERLIGLGRLAATIAHEIKNPLGIIKATAQRLERVQDEQKRAELLRFIPEETERLNRILTGYLSIASPKPAHPERVPIAKLLPQWMNETFGRNDEERERWHLGVEDTGAILADPDAPKQVLINLVNNALDVSADNQIVEIGWGVSDERHGRLTVTDRGPGIPHKLRERVFEPFYTTKAKGSGLGLHAVRMMVERDGGRVRIEDNPGGGARFVVEWPLAKADSAKA
jgi:signal transduction histidine kinase